MFDYFLRVLIQKLTALATLCPIVLEATGRYESFRVPNRPGACLFLAFKARATSANWHKLAFAICYAATFHELTVPIVPGPSLLLAGGPVAIAKAKARFAIHGTNHGRST